MKLSGDGQENSEVFMRVFSVDEVRQVMDKKGYQFFSEGDYNLNIIGVRSGREVTNKFDDTLVVVYKARGNWTSFCCSCTTDPGLGPMKNPGARGRAVMKPGQYVGAYKLGMHKGSHKALVQVKPVTVYRDRNGDGVLDYENPDTGLFGINIHWSSRTHTSTQVDNWSEGCQVGTSPEAYDTFIALCEKAAKIYGNSFTYTLLELSDFE